MNKSAWLALFWLGSITDCYEEHDNTQELRSCSSIHLRRDS
jgi:hypothetical protein